jgi:short-subunit dehydrogenase
VNVVCPAFVATSIFDNASVVGAGASDLRQLADKNLPFGMLTAEDAAARTLAGVARNRAVIVFPFHARVLWWLQRLSPALLAAFARRAIRDFRALRPQ